MTRPVLALLVLMGLPLAAAEPTFAPSPGWTMQAPAVPPPATLNSVKPQDPAQAPEVKMAFRIAPGPCEPTWASLRQHHPTPPAWFNQAKFGVFIHWGPQAAGRSGDWYARRLYRPGNPAYDRHLARYGHPSTVGYKEVLKDWTAPQWDPAVLTQRFHDAGMRFMMVVGVHHDNFDLWDSTYQPWNSVRVGPKQDMLGGWSREARKLGMRFGITFHHEYSWWWWADAYRADRSGPKAGVPYDGHLSLADGKGTWWDGLDPRLLYNIDLGEYEKVTEIAFGKRGVFQNHHDYGVWYAERWALRILDAIDRYDPDLIYTDGNAAEPFCGDKSGAGLRCDAARRMVAHYYNRTLATRKQADTLALIKFQAGNPAVGMTYETQFPRTILRDQAWIGENPVGDWYYTPDAVYDAVTLVRSLLEYASRGGNYACAVPIDPEGGMDPACVTMLADMGAWMRVNGDGMYGSTAWDLWGEGTVGMPNGALGKRHITTPFTARDLRFTVKDGALHAWLMAWPEDRTVLIRSLAEGGPTITRVDLLGHDGPLAWSWTPDGLRVTLPKDQPCRYAWGLKITTAGGLPTAVKKR